jgi:hypothetical protein
VIAACVERHHRAKTHVPPSPSSIR